MAGCQEKDAMEYVPYYRGKYSLFLRVRGKAILDANGLDNADDFLIEKWLTDKSDDDILMKSLLDGHIVLVEITGNHHNTGGWVQLADLPCQFKPVNVGQLGVHKYHSELMAADEVNGLPAIEGKLRTKAGGLQNML